MPRGLLEAGYVMQTNLALWNETMAASHKNDGCAICQEAFTVPDIVRVLDCGHVFHAKCVDPWFIKATFCPLCKRDLKLVRTNSQRSVGRSSQTSSRSESSLRTGQILVGHSNSDPALLGILENHSMGVVHRSSPPTTPDRLAHFHSATSLTISYSDRSLPIMGSSRSERSIGILSSSSSGALPAVQEASDEARAAEDSQRSHSSNPPSPNTVLQEEQGASAPPADAPSVVAAAEEASSEQLHRQRAASCERPARTTRLQQASHSVQLPLGPVVSAGQVLPPHNGGRGRGPICMLRGHTRARDPPTYVIPPHGEQEFQPTEEVISRRERSSSVPPPVVQPCPSAPTDDKLSASLQNVRIVSPPPSSSTSAASTTPAQPPSSTPPGVAATTTRTFVATHVAYPAQVHKTTTTYLSTGGHGPPTTAWCPPYSVARQAYPQVAAPQLHRAVCPVVASRSYASLQG